MHLKLAAILPYNDCVKQRNHVIKPGSETVELLKKENPELTSPGYQTVRT